MAVMAIYRSDAIPPDGFAKFRSALPLGPAPRQALSHTYGRTASGEMVVVDVWATREALDQYIEQAIKPALANSGQPWSEPEVIEIETFMVTADTKPYELPFAPEPA